jgi:NAD binding domain of 6-phosphogluconate dehydrogenase
VLALCHRVPNRAVRQQFRKAAVLLLPIVSFDDSFESIRYTIDLVFATDYADTCRRNQNWVRIARNLARAGYRLRVYNRTASKAAPLRELDAVSVMQTPVEVADPGGIVLSMLADDHAVDQTTAGLADKLGAAGLHVSLSTIATKTEATWTGRQWRSRYSNQPAWTNQTVANNS